MLFICSDNLNN